MGDADEPGVGELPDEALLAILGRLGGGDLPAAEPAIVGQDEPDPLESLLDRLLLRRGGPPRYRSQGCVGRGGMGEVLQVDDLDLDRSLAMKVLLTGAGPEGSKARRRRFLEEAQITGQLDHPGVVPIHELGVDAEGRPYFTMQLVQGRDLAAILEHRAAEPEWTTPRILQALLRVCEAVAYAHSKGVLHRDLKPANVMVGQFGEVYVMDWGLAKVVGTEAPASAPASASAAAEESAGRPARATLEGQVLGTPSYMSPEQARGDLQALDGRTDVYSLGAILYDVLAGHPPYADRKRNALAALIAVNQGPPESLERIAPEASPELVSICAKAMHRDPERRYSGALELAADLRAFLEDRVVTAHRTGAFIELAKWIRRNRAIASISCALLVAVTLGFVVSSVLYVEKEHGLRELRLSGVDGFRGRLRRLVDTEPTLWPPTPERVRDLEWWVTEAESLLIEVPELLSTLEAEGEADPRVAELRTVAAELGALADPEHGQLLATSEPHGLGVRTRLELARTVEARSLTSPDAQAAWTTALAEIGEPGGRYGGLRLRPQRGLMPLGRDPASGLQEFADVSTGMPPTRDPEAGALRIEVPSGLVFVLIPAGTATIGATRDPAGPHYDPALALEAYARSESPVHRVALDAFLLSKYEVSQAQWARLTGARPSRIRPGDVLAGRVVTALHPVESVSWNEASAMLARFGLALPTEAQWEYAARAGTDTPWWTGSAATSLIGKANLADGSAVRAGIVTETLWIGAPDDDGWPATAPVDLGAANPFGLVHVLGNVNELCRDSFAHYDQIERGREGLAVSIVPGKVLRGGSFHGPPERARSSFRIATEPGHRFDRIGLRPIRRLEPRIPE